MSLVRADAATGSVTSLRTQLLALCLCHNIRRGYSAKTLAQSANINLHWLNANCVACAGIFTPQAEIWNGRAAMLGFGILLALEYNAGVPFF